jgi:hypothetical protein
VRRPCVGVHHGHGVNHGDTTGSVIPPIYPSTTYSRNADTYEPRALLGTATVLPQNRPSNAASAGTPPVNGEEGGSGSGTALAGPDTTGQTGAVSGSRPTSTFALNRGHQSSPPAGTSWHTPLAHPWHTTQLQS